MRARNPRERIALPRWLTSVLQVAVSAGLLGTLIVIVDWRRLRAAADALSIETLVIACIVCLAAQASLVLRWRALIDMLGVCESWSTSWHSVFAGLFLSNFLPGTLGSDGLRIVLLTKSCGRASTAVGAVAYERLMQLALYVVVVAIAALAPMPWLEPWLRALIVGVGGGAVMTILVLLYWLGQRTPEETLADGGLVQAAWRLISTILMETGRMQTLMHRHRRAAIGFWLASILNVGLIFAMWLIVLSAIGEPIGLAAVALAAGAAAIATAIPLSLNGIGIFEAAAVALLSLAGVPTSHGFLVVLALRAAVLVTTFVGLPSAALLWRERRT